MIFAPIPAQVCDGGYEKNVMKKDGESLVVAQFTEASATKPRSKSVVIFRGLVTNDFFVAIF